MTHAEFLHLLRDMDGLPLHFAPDEDPEHALAVTQAERWGRGGGGVNQLCVPGGCVQLVAACTCSEAGKGVRSLAFGLLRVQRACLESCWTGRGWGVRATGMASVELGDLLGVDWLPGFWDFFCRRHHRQKELDARSARLGTAQQQSQTRAEDLKQLQAGGGWWGLVELGGARWGLVGLGGNCWWGEDLRGGIEGELAVPSPRAIPVT